MEFTEEKERILKRNETLSDEMKNQSDRGVAIIVASFVEEELLAAVKCTMENDKTAWNKLFENSGPMATFSAKIELAKLHDIINRDEYLDLHTIRRIRNEFAHELTSKDDGALTFNTPHIRDKCLSLRNISTNEHSNPRAAFIRAGSTLNTKLHLSSIFELFPRSFRKR